MDEKIRWGIIGTGGIARAFAEGLSYLPDAALVGVGSRSQESADAFGARFGIPHRHPTYEALAADPDIDAVYISTPHTLHCENTLLCLEAGKAVLCEKPFAMNVTESQRMIAAAREKNLFLMEAMWTRFIPATRKMRELLPRIGEIRMVQADFGFNAPYDPQSRLFNPDLGGGALLDVGIYPVSMAIYVLGVPDGIQTHAHIGATGVDEQFGALFTYQDGRMALLAGALRLDTPREAVIMGTEGSLRLHYPFWQSEQVTLTTRSGTETFRVPIEGSGYKYEAAHVHECLRAGRTESDLMPLDDTLAIMRVMDDIRAGWGLRYAADGGE